MSLFAELQRRNVLRAGVLYIGAIWALAQGISQLGPSLGLPEWATRWFLVAGVVGFPFWLYELTPQGFKRESDVPLDASITRTTGRKLDVAIIGVLAVAVVLLLTDRFVMQRGASAVAATQAMGAPANSIAVLPFTNESDDKQQDYFAEGIAEDLLNLLTEVQPLRVAARTSSFAFKGKGLGIAQIAATLHVAHVLEGTVRKAGNKVRVTAQLVRASDGYQIWSHSYDRNLDDVFAIQDGIAADVVKNLKVSLLGAVPRARETDPVTYALYLQGRQMRRQKTAESLQTANALLQQALAIDPRYAPAWDQLARNIVNQMGIGVMPNNEGLGRAREATERALAIDPSYAPAHAELGVLALYQNDLPAAAQNFQRALALDPSELGVLGSSAQLLMALGRLQSLIAVNEYLVARDPVNTVPLQNLGYAYLTAGLYDEAIAKIGTLLSLSPGDGGAQFNIGVALLLKGDAAGALAKMQQEKAEVWRMIGLPLAYCALGRKTDADVAFAGLIAKYATDSPYNIAYDYAYCGEADLAFKWLDKAVEVQDPGLYEIVAHPLFDKIHADPRWLPFLRKLGHAPEQLAKIMFTVTLPGIDAHAAETAPVATVPVVARPAAPNP